MSRPLDDVERAILARREGESLLRACKATERWRETSSEMGSVAHGYYDAVEQAMEVAVEIAEEIIRHRSDVDAGKNV